MNGHEPVLHALAVEPRVVRPGDTLQLVFRTRNLGARPAPAATVRFVLPEALEPLDPLAVAVDPVGPGADVVAVLRARVAPVLDDRRELTVRASLELADGPLASNACTVVVRSRPRLDGPASGVELIALDHEIVRVRATVVNEGDGPACNLRLVVPVPAGCVALEGEPATRLERARLAVGERVDLAYDARIVAPATELHAHAYAEAAGTRCALPARAALVLAPRLAAPRVGLAAGRRRLELTVGLRNDGWADARDVRVRIALPAPLRPLDAGLLVDGVPVDVGSASGFARAEQDGDALLLDLVRVPARGEQRIALAAYVPPECSGGMVAVAVGGQAVGADDHEVELAFVPEPLREVRLRVVSAPAAAEPGGRAELVAELANAGDRSETLVLSAHGSGAEPARSAPTTIAPGAVVALALAVRVADELEDGAPLALTLVAADAGGERARAELPLVARDRAWLALRDLPRRDGERVTYALRNAGATTARRVVALVGDETHELGPIAAGADAAFTAGVRAARRGGMLRVAGRDALALPTLDEQMPAEVRAALAAPATVVAGAPFAVRAEIAVAEPVESLAIRLPAVAGASYVPGSTVLDGRALLDRGPESPLAGAGLMLRGVPGAARIALSWSLLADAALGDDAALTLMAELAVDGDPREVEPVRVAVRARAAFAARPAGLAYHVDACALAPDGALVPLPPAAPLAPEVGALVPCQPEFEGTPAKLPEPLPALVLTTGPDALPDVFTFNLRLDGARLDEIARLSHGAPGDALVSHLLVLRAFFPESQTADDERVAGALDAARGALCDVFDRLFVKLRIPGFDVGAADLEDPTLRRALVRLFERLLDAAPGGAASAEDVGSATARLACARVREVLSSFADAPFGAPAMLRALVVLLPTRCGDAALAAALARYAQALDDALARCADLPTQRFDDALAAGDRALDDARADLLAALRPRLAGDPAR